MTAATVKLVIEAGATFRKTVACNEPDGSPMDLTGYQPRMQIRRRASDTDYLIELTDINGGIQVGDGQLTLYIGADVTATFDTKKAVYDLELQVVGDPSEVIRLLEGDVEIRPEVTR